MNQTDPSVLDFWQAFDSLEPIGQPWHQSAMVASQVSCLKDWMLIFNGMKPEDLKLSKFTDFMPPRFLHQEKEPEEEASSTKPTRDEEERILASLAGF